jgi:hypothetical protein
MRIAAGLQVLLLLMVNGGLALGEPRGAVLRVASL